MFGNKKNSDEREEEYLAILEKVIDRLDDIEQRFATPIPKPAEQNNGKQFVTNHIAEYPERIVEEAVAEQEALDQDNDIESITKRIRAAVEGELSKLNQPQKIEDPIPKLTKLEDMVYALRKMAGIGEDTASVPENRDTYMNLYAQITVSDLVHWNEDMVHKGQYTLANMASKDLRDMYDRFRVDLDLVLNTADIEINRLKQDIDGLEKKNRQLLITIEKERQANMEKNPQTKNEVRQPVVATIKKKTQEFRGDHTEEQLQGHANYMETYLEEYLKKKPEMLNKWSDKSYGSRKKSLEGVIRLGYLRRIGKMDDKELTDYLSETIRKKYNIPEFEN
jgi:hypothetical protein